MDQPPLVEACEQLDDAVIRLATFLQRQADPIPPWQPAKLHETMIADLNLHVQKVQNCAFGLVREGNSTIARHNNKAQKSERMDAVIFAVRDAFSKEVRDVLHECTEQSHDRTAALEAEVATLKMVIKQKDAVGISDAADKQLKDQAELIKKLEERNTMLEPKHHNQDAHIEQLQSKIFELENAAKQRDAECASIAAKLDVAEASNMALDATAQNLLKLMFDTGNHRSR